MDNMFRPSSGHRQVQYKEMWVSTELRTRMGCTNPHLFLYIFIQKYTACAMWSVGPVSTSDHIWRPICTAVTVE